MSRFAYGRVWSELIMMKTTTNALDSGWIPSHVLEIKAKSYRVKDRLERPTIRMIPHDLRVRSCNHHASGNGDKLHLALGFLHLNVWRSRRCIAQEV